MARILLTVAVLATAPVVASDYSNEKVHSSEVRRVLSETSVGMSEVSQVAWGEAMNDLLADHRSVPTSSRKANAPTAKMDHENLISSNSTNADAIASASGEIRLDAERTSNLASDVSSLFAQSLERIPHSDSNELQGISFRSSLSVPYLLNSRPTFENYGGMYKLNLNSKYPEWGLFPKRICFLEKVSISGVSSYENRKRDFTNPDVYPRNTNLLPGRCKQRIQRTEANSFSSVTRIVLAGFLFYPIGSPQDFQKNEGPITIRAGIPGREKIKSSQLKLPLLFGSLAREAVESVYPFFHDNNNPVPGFHRTTKGRAQVLTKRKQLSELYSYGHGHSLGGKGMKAPVNRYFDCFEKPIQKTIPIWLENQREPHFQNS